MKIIMVKYDASKLDKGSPERKRFKNQTQDTNVIYFFCNNEKCMYIGETKKCLYDRCFKNSPKHKERQWFKESNIIYILQLDSRVDSIARRALEGILIATIRPKYNKK